MIIAFITLYLTQKLHFGIKETGYIMTFFGIGSLVGSYIGGRLTDRVGSFPVQFWSLMLNGIILILLQEITGFELMCVGVFTMALISEVFRPANSVAIAQNCTAETRTRSIFSLPDGCKPRLGCCAGLWRCFGCFWLAFLVLGGWIDLHYRGCFISRIGFPETMQLPVQDAAVLPEKETDQQANSPYKDRKFLIFAALTTLHVVVFMQFLWTVPVYWKEVYGWSETMVGLVSALNGFFGVCH